MCEELKMNDNGTINMPETWMAIILIEIQEYDWIDKELYTEGAGDA